MRTTSVSAPNHALHLKDKKFPRQTNRRNRKRRNLRTKGFKVSALQVSCHRCVDFVRKDLYKAVQQAKLGTTHSANLRRSWNSPTLSRPCPSAMLEATEIPAHLSWD